MGGKVHTAAEKKDSWMTANVEVGYTGKVDGGLARLQLVLTDASIMSQDQAGKEVNRHIDETDRRFFFTQTTTGEVYKVDHPEDEKFFLITLKKEIAAMHHVSQKAMQKGPSTESFALVETDNLGSHDTTYRVEESKSHFVVHKSKRRVTYNKGVFGAAEQHGGSGVTMFHELTEKIHIHKESGTIDKAERKQNVRCITAVYKYRDSK